VRWIEPEVEVGRNRETGGRRGKDEVETGRGDESQKGERGREKLIESDGHSYYSVMRRGESGVT
jgi:hypothetical protein